MPGILVAIAAFAKPTGPVSPWNNLPRTDVADRLKDLVQNPDHLNQGADSLCGPAAFFNVWIADDPKSFARYVFQMYNAGAAPIGTLHVKAGSTLLHQDYQKVLDQIRTNPDFNGIAVPSADWMSMSALRDSENNFFTAYDGTPAAKWQGGTDPSEIESWLRATGLYSSVRQDSTRTVAAAKMLNPTVNRRIILEVDDIMIVPTNTPAGGPNHFMCLRSPITENAGSVKFDYWTWGHQQETVTVSDTDFEKYYYSAIIAEF
jgi:hypothetical protein